MATCSSHAWHTALYSYMDYHLMISRLIKQLDQIIIIYISVYGTYNVYMCTKVHPEGLYIHRYISTDV